MTVNLSEYKMILQTISDLEQIKKEAEAEFDTYCAERYCTECALYGRNGGCYAEVYFKLKESGVIK